MSTSEEYAADGVMMWMCDTKAQLNSPMMATTSASMWPWAILSRPAWEKSRKQKHSWASWATKAWRLRCAALHCCQLVQQWIFMSAAWSQSTNNSNSLLMQLYKKGAWKTVSMCLTATSSSSGRKRRRRRDEQEVGRAEERGRVCAFLKMLLQYATKYT